jgi:hypothetical protein
MPLYKKTCDQCGKDFWMVTIHDECPNAENHFRHDDLIEDTLP